MLEVVKSWTTLFIQWWLWVISPLLFHCEIKFDKNNICTRLWIVIAIDDIPHRINLQRKLITHWYTTDIESGLLCSNASRSAAEMDQRRGGERARDSLQIGLTIYFVSNAPSCRCCSSFGGPVSCVLLVLFSSSLPTLQNTQVPVRPSAVGGCMWPSGHNNYRQRWGWNVGYSAGRAWTILMAAAVQERTFCSLLPLPAGYPSIGLLLSNIARCCCILQSQSPFIWFFIGHGNINRIEWGTLSLPSL